MKIDGYKKVGKIKPLYYRDFNFSEIPYVSYSSLIVVTFRVDYLGQGMSEQT